MVVVETDVVIQLRFEIPAPSLRPALANPFDAVISAGTVLRLYCIGDYACCSVAAVAVWACVKRSRDLGSSIRRVSFDFFLNLV